jgi:hypothetical protein
MSNMHVIGQIEKKLGQSLKKIGTAEIEKADHFPEKAYAVDEENNVTGLWLDGYTVSLISEISELTQLSVLVLRGVYFINLDFLQKLKKLTSLNLLIWVVPRSQTSLT